MTAAPEALQPQPSSGRRAWLWCELVLLYVGLPILITLGVHGLRRPLWMFLLPVMAVIITVMLADRSFSLRATLARGLSLRQLGEVLALFVPLGAGLLWYAAITEPDRFLEIPLNAPRLWLVIMVAYPLISVTTQELVYRVFFAHRYGVLFGKRWLAMVAVNGALFAFGHVMFLNWTAIVVSLVGGMLFMARYLATRSAWAVLLEHGLYGNLLFTSGLGVYFFTGVSSLRLG